MNKINDKNIIHFIMCIYVGETALAEFGYASFRHLEHKNKQMELFISYRLCSITSSNQWEEHLHRLPHFYHTSFIRPYHLKSPSHDDDLILDVLYDHKRAFIKKRDAVHTVLPWIMVSSCVMNKHHGRGGIHDFRPFIVFLSAHSAWHIGCTVHPGNRKET